MNRVICLIFFIVGALYVSFELATYYEIQRRFNDAMLIPLLLLGNLAYLAFKPAPRVT